jgi:predicted signal transduction protein with EAL and GGDEF domain
VDSGAQVANTSVDFMTPARNPANSLPGTKIPDAMYMGFVDSHLVDIKALVLSSIVVIAAQIVVAVAANSVWLWISAAGMTLVCGVRLYIMALHGRSRPSASLETARKWEIAYSAGATAYLTALGLWALATFCVTEDGFSRLLATTLAVCYAFSMWTRSFAISRGNNLQILAAFVPLSVAMIVAGGWYPAAIVFGIIPLGIFVKASSERLRANFLAVVAAQSQSAMLAKRLDMALNNMSHGLVMVDAKDRLTLANSQILNLFGLDEHEVKVGADLRGIVRKLVRNKVVARSEVDRIWQALFHNGCESDFVVPFETIDKRAIEITVHRMNGEGVVVVVQDVTERRNAARAIDRMARVDSVTELPNRRCFEEELSAMLRAPGDGQIPVNVLFLDLDDFKQVNDSLGHARGDKLLAAIAKRLQAIVRPSDLVARWGGDEFAILQRPVKDPLQTADGYEVIVGASIGSASAPNDGMTPEAILSNADMALYAAKGEGRGNWRAFEKSMDAKIQIRRLIELDLRAAVANDAIEVYYQPIVAVATGEIAGFEALARWNHPVRGRVPPNEFIPIVEELGLMEEFGASVLRRACLACASWPNNVSVSVNLSPMQFRNGRVEQTVLDALSAAKLAPERLDLEITESTLLDDRGSTRATLESLRKLGVRISLDDFGTGYSSLSYVLAFPLDRIKIDRSFTIGLGLQERASILVESVAQMCARLGMSVLVEGVETDLQLRFIERVGSISEVQGFYFSPAVPELEARKMIGQKKRLNAA